MSLPPILQRLRLPVIAAPMFIAGNPKLVIEQCKAGIVGSFPALNARPKEALDGWLTEIETALAGVSGAAPYAVNQIVHKSNDRLQHDVDVCVRHKVPITITSLRAPTEVVAGIHSYGGIVLHDVINVRHAEKALEAGVDGLILVCAGAGGHAGTLSPFALIGAVRRFFDGPIVLSGAIASGYAILAALAAGADLAYIGTRFLATPEASVHENYKRAVLAADVDGSTLVARGKLPIRQLKNAFSARYEAAEKAGATQEELEALFNTSSLKQAALDGDVEWGKVEAGQSAGLVDEILPAAELVKRLISELEEARKRLASL